MQLKDVDDDMMWAKPLASFTAVVGKGNQIEIPTHISRPLGIKANAVVEVAYVKDSEKVVVYHTVVGIRNRIGIKKAIAGDAQVKRGDTVLVGILSVFHSRAEGLVIVFDTDAQPDWYAGERQ